MYYKYFVYIDDDGDVYRIAVTASCEDAARASCKGFGEIIAVRDVSEDYPISVSKVADALRCARFGDPEIKWITDLLKEYEIAE